MKGMQISGIGLAGGFGCGQEELLAALAQGEVEPSLCTTSAGKLNPGVSRCHHRAGRISQ